MGARDLLEGSSDRVGVVSERSKVELSLPRATKSKAARAGLDTVSAEANMMGMGKPVSKQPCWQHWCRTVTQG